MIQKPPSVQQALAGLDDLYDRYQRLGRDGPAADSLAGRDSGTECGQHAWMLAAAAVGSAIDHLVSWRELHKAGVQPIFAHLTLIRAAIEGAVYCRWLVDPTIGADERLRRGVGAQLKDYEERGKFERLPIKPATDGGRPATERIADLEKAIEKRGLEPLKPLGNTDLCTRYVTSVPGVDGGELIYRLLSAFAHAKQWAILPTSVYTEQGPAAGLPNSTMIAVTASPGVAGMASLVAFDTLQLAVSELAAYGGR